MEPRSPIFQSDSLPSEPSKKPILTSVQFSRSFVSDFLWSHGLQHARFPCPSTPGAYSNSCPLNRWYPPIISSSAIPFCFCLQSLPASMSFPMNQLFTSGGIKWFLNFLKDEQISLLKKMFLQRKRQGIFFDQFIVKHKTFPQYKHNTRHSLLIEEDFH